jgi:hypothetical protein
MSDDAFRYDLLAQEALRGVVRSVLRSVEKRGLPGEHHFVITFDTQAPGVSLSRRLLDRYPHDMTIVVQYQFWGLKVYENSFEIGLSFNNVPETLAIPFRAVKSFQDPSVGFMLQFTSLETQRETETAPSAEGETSPAPGEADPLTSAQLPNLPDPALPGPAQQPLAAGEDGETPANGGGATASQGDGDQEHQDDSGEGNAQPAEVVHLDAFRKK